MANVSLYSPVLQEHLENIERALPRYLPHEGGMQKTVVEAMAYACEGGGKRLRPVLVLEFCRLCGGSPAAALPFACALEMIHSYSLVHDDLPCMDNSPLQSEGREVGLEVLEELQRGKTAALLTAACEMGCLLGNASAEQRRAAHTYGENVGLSFQIIDDILDATSTPEELGKPVGSDEINQKTTYVSLLGMDEAVRLAERRTQQGVDALRLFGSDAGDLQRLAASLLQRKK